MILGGTDYYKVTFNSNGCTYSSNTGRWQIGGRYQPGDPGSQYKKDLHRPRARPRLEPDGRYRRLLLDGNQPAWVRKYFAGKTSGDALNYIYNLGYCCDS